MFKFFHKKNDKGSRFFLILMIVVAVIAVASFVLLLKPAISAVNKLTKNKAELVVIQPINCDDCFDIYQVVDFLKNDFEVKFTSEKEYKSNSKTAQKLIKDNEITVLPTFLIRGAGVEGLGLDKILAEGTFGKNEKELFVYKNIFPPYLDMTTGDLRGFFDMFMLIDDSCTDCYDVEIHKTAFENLIINPINISKFDISSDEGKKLVEDYNIELVPTIVLKGDLSVYQGFKDLWETVGSIEEDGAYVFREDGLNLMGVYKNLKTGELIEPVVPAITDQMLELQPTQ